MFIGDEEPDHFLRLGAEGPRGLKRRIGILAHQRQDAFPCAGADAGIRLVVEDQGDGCLADSCGLGDVIDGDAVHMRNGEE